jgi:hypothetical protein
MRIKESYGHPPIFIPTLFLKVFAVILALVLVSFILISTLHEPIGMVDIVGTLICAPIVTYLIHLWLAPLE